MSLRKATLCIYMNMELCVCMSEIVCVYKSVFDRHQPFSK